MTDMIIGVYVHFFHHLIFLNQSFNEEKMSIANIIDLELFMPLSK